MPETQSKNDSLSCYHCGDVCIDSKIHLEEKVFCCQGCLMVYDLLNKNNLCTYYDLNENPGSAIKIEVRKEKFAYLDDGEIEKKILSFADENQKHVTLHLPTIHCSSCLYLLENLHKINKGVIRAQVNFSQKDVEIIFDPKKTSLRKIAETLAGIGYEPYISLNDLKGKKPGFSKSLIYKVGVAGFCFGNIMLISFADYFGLQDHEAALQNAFRIASFILALPIVFYSAIPFYSAAWGGLKNRFINIDAPIVLAVWVTFFRSVYEIVTGIGSGYFDSMSGIVFFMLIGRILQEKTHKELSFDRDYSAYFPIAVSVVENDILVPKQLPHVKVGDTILIHNEELIPADGILTKGKAWIDYSFVTGESNPVSREMGEMIYAGGKQVGANIELLVIKEVSQSYLTKLWDSEKNSKAEAGEKHSFVDALSRYFSIALFAIAISASVYWYFTDVSKMWQVFTAVLIIACPCALLLSNTFTNGHILRILSANGFYLKNAFVIEAIAKVNYVVFDKTGTLTKSEEKDIDYSGYPLTETQKEMVKALASQSTHPLSVALNKSLEYNIMSRVQGYKEHPGFGIEGFYNETLVSLGSPQFVKHALTGQSKLPQVHLAIEDRYLGFFSIKNQFRSGILNTINQLKSSFGLSVISGDNNFEEEKLRLLFGYDTPFFFNQKPHQKVWHVKQLENSGKNVMMIGDGLNDSSALLCSSVGVAISDNTNNFTPASDAILDAGYFEKLPQFFSLCKANKHIIMASFILSIIYNIFGIGYAVSGQLSPLVAAILMPLSSISILLLTYLGSLWKGRQLGLKTN
jgi:Cu+-exporting ATPase